MRNITLCIMCIAGLAATMAAGSENDGGIRAIGVNADCSTFAIAEQPGGCRALVAVSALESRAALNANGARVIVGPASLARAMTGLQINSGTAQPLATSLLLRWTERQKPATAQGYRIRRRGASASGVYLPVGPGALAQAAWRDGDLAWSRTYFYIVDLVESAGAVRQWTGVFSGRTPDPPLSASTLRELILHYYVAILGRAPEPGALEAWEQGFREEVTMNVGVLYIAQQIALRFFLSDEYAERGRSDAEFISDCYEVFLRRAPSASELGDWLAGRPWERAAVLSQFIRSGEFRERIGAQFPALEGSAARNFVAAAYMAVLARQADVGGLDMRAEEMAGGADRRAAAVALIRELLTSPEYLASGPDNADRVERLYRAFLGRYPTAQESAYWTAELDSGRRNLDQVIEAFAQSEEFTDRLEQFFGHLDGTPLQADRWGGYR